ncbi:MAG: AbrB/MazE/SpoVT family DNA-binding domain-containing protein [Thermoplasmatales archaeon]|nr:AbrB/MazE/SpoVT family DNA-binding domain-containing protein [Thermoplasmatales archaeon]
MVLHIVFDMERKLRETNGSYVITIPKQVCDLYGFKPNDKFSIEPIGNDELRLRKPICTCETLRGKRLKKTSNAIVLPPYHSQFLQGYLEVR